MSDTIRSETLMEDYNKMLRENIKLKESIKNLENIIVEARSIYFKGLEDGSSWVKINANNPVVKDWLEKTSNIKVDSYSEVKDGAK